MAKQGGLTPDQVSELKLNQVHLATGLLVIEPDAFGDSSTVSERPISLADIEATLGSAMDKVRSLIEAVCKRL